MSKLASVISFLSQYYRANVTTIMKKTKQAVKGSNSGGGFFGLV